MDKISRRNRYAETGDLFVARMKLKKFSIILDLGCGENLYKDLNGVIGIDVDQTHADVKANMINLPYEDSSIDCIFAFGSLVYGARTEYEHIDAKILLKAQLKEIHRVLKPNGEFYGRSHYLETLNTNSIKYYADQYGFKQTELKMIFHADTKVERIYWEWIKI